MIHTTQYSMSPMDLKVLQMLTSDQSVETAGLHGHGLGHGNRRQSATTTKTRDRRPPVDPLLVAAAASAGPDVTRNHYLHEFFPHSHAYASCDDDGGVVLPSTRTFPGNTTMASSSSLSPSHRMISQQKPRRERLAEVAAKQGSTSTTVSTSGTTTEPVAPVSITGSTSTETGSTCKRRLSTNDPTTIKLLRQQQQLVNNSIQHVASKPSSPSTTLADSSSASSPTAATANSAAKDSSSKATTTTTTTTTLSAPLPPLVVKCQVRTRIPTPHGHIFLHLYSNNHDNKEHLAFVADRAQMDSQDITDLIGPNQSKPYIRSKSLDSEWRQGETEMERVVRGAYVGRLSASSIHAVASTSRDTSTQSAPSASPTGTTTSYATVEPPMVRIHSECFTGETIGSQRCDCGEQLDEAFRLITQAQRGIVVYLRQEGRGIGLLEKMRAYNLQDLGHDTVTANLMLGHGADMRTYDIAGAILRDLAVDEVRLLTNNPDKIEQIEKEGVRVVERVAMVPRMWVPSARPEKTSRRSRHHGQHHRRSKHDGSTRQSGKRAAGEAPKDGGASEAPTRRRRRPARMSGAALLHAALLAETIPPSPMPSSGVPSEMEDNDSSSLGTGSISDEANTGAEDYLSYGAREKTRAATGRSNGQSVDEYYSSESYSDDDSYDDVDQVDDDDNDNDDDDEDSTDEDDADDESLMLRRSGVGMIGAGMTRSAELEKYLRTKIERMGHMLEAPAPAAAASLSSTTTSTTTASGSNTPRRRAPTTMTTTTTDRQYRRRSGSDDRVSSAAAPTSSSHTNKDSDEGRRQRRSRALPPPSPSSGNKVVPQQQHPLASSVVSVSDLDAELEEEEHDDLAAAAQTKCSGGGDNGSYRDRDSASHDGTGSERGTSEEGVSGGRSGGTSRRRLGGNEVKTDEDPVQCGSGCEECDGE